MADDDDGGTRKDNTHTHTTQQQTERVREDTGAPVGSTRSSDGDRLVPLHVYTQIEPRGGGGRDGRAEGPMRGSRAGSFFASTDGLGGRRRTVMDARRAVHYAEDTARGTVTAINSLVGLIRLPCFRMAGLFWLRRPTAWLVSYVPSSFVLERKRRRRRLYQKVMGQQQRTSTYGQSKSSSRNPINLPIIIRGDQLVCGRPSLDFEASARVSGLMEQNRRRRRKKL